MRAFIALDLPDDFRMEVAGISRVLARTCDGHFGAYENLHVTLAFLGEIDEAGSAAAIEALDRACEGVEPVLLKPDGLGKFGKPTDATLWLGLSPTQELTSLAACVREQLAAHWLAFDDKPFKPHITLGRRVYIPRKSLPELPFPLPTYATQVTLYKSTLSSTGATYKPLYTVEL